MATTFYPNKPVNAEPLHSGTVIYADDTCIRTTSAEQLGGGGIEGAGGMMMVISFLLWLFLTPLDLNFFLIITFAFSLLVILPIIFFRYKSNYLLFSYKSQEIYYIKNPKWIIKMKWKDVVGEYQKVTIFTGSGIAQIDTLRLNGTSQYGDNSAVPASLPFVVGDEEHATQLWAYLQEYMKNGPKGLESPSYDRIKEGFWNEAKRLTKQIFYDAPKDVLTMIFFPKKKSSILFRIVLIPLALIGFPFAIILMLPAKITTAFVNSTRTRAPFPEDLLPNITDNPECYGKEQ